MEAILPKSPTISATSAHPKSLRTAFTGKTFPTRRLTTALLALDLQTV